MLGEPVPQSEHSVEETIARQSLSPAAVSSNSLQHPILRWIERYVPDLHEHLSINHPTYSKIVAYSLDNVFFLYEEDRYGFREGIFEPLMPVFVDRVPRDRDDAVRQFLILVHDLFHYSQGLPLPLHRSLLNTLSWKNLESMYQRLNSDSHFRQEMIQTGRVYLEGVTNSWKNSLNEDGLAALGSYLTLYGKIDDKVKDTIAMMMFVNGEKTESEEWHPTWPPRRAPQSGLTSKDVTGWMNGYIRAIKKIEASAIWFSDFELMDYLSRPGAPLQSERSTTWIALMEKAGYVEQGAQQTLLRNAYFFGRIPPTEKGSNRRLRKLLVDMCDRGSDDTKIVRNALWRQVLISGDIAQPWKIEDRFISLSAHSQLISFESMRHHLKKRAKEIQEYAVHPDPLKIALTTERMEILSTAVSGERAGDSSVAPDLGLHAVIDKYRKAQKLLELRGKIPQLSVEEREALERKYLIPKSDTTRYFSDGIEAHRIQYRFGVPTDSRDLSSLDIRSTWNGETDLWLEDRERILLEKYLSENENSPQFKSERVMSLSEQMAAFAYNELGLEGSDENAPPKEEHLDCIIDSYLLFSLPTRLKESLCTKHLNEVSQPHTPVSLDESYRFESIRLEGSTLEAKHLLSVIAEARNKFREQHSFTRIDSQASRTKDKITIARHSFLFPYPVFFDDVSTLNPEPDLFSFIKRCSCVANGEFEYLNERDPALHLLARAKYQYLYPLMSVLTYLGSGEWRRSITAAEDKSDPIFSSPKVQIDREQNSRKLHLKCMEWRAEATTLAADLREGKSISISFGLLHNSIQELLAFVGGIHDFSREFFYSFDRNEADIPWRQIQPSIDFSTPFEKARFLRQNRVHRVASPFKE